MRILIVDDAAFMRRMLSDILVRDGHEIVGEASNGREALERYKELHPDLVTMDITMSEVNGLDGVRLIMEYDKNAKIIMCSAMGQQSMVMDALQSGAVDFIVKPFNPDMVLDAVRRVRS